MTSLQKFEHVNRKVSLWLEWIGMTGLLLMMGITCIDVIGAKLFLTPIFGALDMVTLSQLVAISFAAGTTLLLGRHVKVEFFVMLFPRRIQGLINSIVDLIGLAFFMLIVWRLLIYASHTGGEVTATVRIPLYPFAYGIAFASVPCCLVFLARFFNSLIQMVKK